MVAQIMEELTIHAQLEEEIFYRLPGKRLKMMR